MSSPARAATIERIRRLCEIAFWLWAQACRFDHVPVKSAFVVFSDDNGYALAHDRVVAERLRLECTFY